MSNTIDPGHKEKSDSLVTWKVDVPPLPHNGVTPITKHVTRSDTSLCGFAWLTVLRIPSHLTTSAERTCDSMRFTAASRRFIALSKHKMLAWVCTRGYDPHFTLQPLKMTLKFTQFSILLYQKLLFLEFLKNLITLLNLILMNYPIKMF